MTVFADDTANWDTALARARAHAPFLARALDQQPEIAALLAAGASDAAVAVARDAGEGIAATGRALRLEKRALATVLAVGDLAGAFPLATVVSTLSAFADRALDAAIRAAIGRRVDGAEPGGFVALALGKQGARELNYSSDIDPILLFDPDTLPRRTRDEPGEVAQRYAREIVALLSNVTEHGYVFRVDLRLRPASETSPLAVPVARALSHYESSALTWERLAFLRARSVAGDIGMGERFLDTITPFVWRRSLDFGTIDEIARLTARIRASHDGPPVPSPGYNVKLGRGGIREIEFYAQTLQLIHGGRDPGLRVPGTRAALNALAAAGHIGAEDARALGTSYDGLRTIEHRLQMVDDRQTHSLPEGAALENVAMLAGYEDTGGFVAACSALTEPVAERFDALLARQADRNVVVPDMAGRRFVKRVRGWADGHFSALRSEAALAAFEKCQPMLIDAIARADDSERALDRWEGLLANAPVTVNLFRLLAARPALLERLMDILTLADPLANRLARRPALLDTLLDTTATELPGSVASIRRALRPLVAEPDYEQQLDRLRVVTGETRFALGVQLISHTQDPLDIAEALSRLAEAGVHEAVRIAEAEFAAKHGRFTDRSLAVLALGRFGGGALTHASDLDIVYLFDGVPDDPLEVESDGLRPLGPSLYFNRLAQRVTAALSVPTAEGVLYDVDTRLRPQGAQGPLAVSIAGFDRYQRADAWTWEHMALARARIIVATPPARAAIEASIAATLGKSRDPAALRADILKMRDEMARHKPPRGPLDVKLLRGGLVDVEFILHFLQLRDGVGVVPDLSDALAAQMTAGLLDPALAGAHRLMTRLLIAARLLAPDLALPYAGAYAALAAACGLADADDLLPAVAHARETVATQWRRTFDTELETDQ